MLLGEWFSALLSRQLVLIWSYFRMILPLLSLIEELSCQFIVGWVISGLVLLYHCLNLLLLACDFWIVWWIWPPLCSALLFILLFHFLLLFLMVLIWSALFCYPVLLMYSVTCFWKVGALLGGFGPYVLVVPLSVCVLDVLDMLCVHMLPDLIKVICCPFPNIMEIWFEGVCFCDAWVVFVHCGLLILIGYHFWVCWPSLELFLALVVTPLFVFLFTTLTLFVVKKFPYRRSLKLQTLSGTTST